MEQLEKVTLKLKANVYFDGGVVSHTVITADGERKTVGLIRKGEYHFTTDAPERMDIISGTCRVKLAGEKDWKTYSAGAGFNVAEKSAFDIAVDTGLAEYLCSFLN
ncbi:MAG: hypothetical protein A2901_04080 [Elusimicrobia bacterium RIFCSPLOWO2_01_FULL_54_10]|nr:MAG: hypothetical protein A2901_04080 [Elusimicrobia bacterium RIFCSPLOWO2_01_FULL_54_10]